MHRGRKAFLAMLAGTAALSLPCHAQTTANSIPPRIPTEIFVEPGYMGRPLLSPDGQRIMFRENIAKKVLIGIKPVDGEKIDRIALPEKHDLNWYRWATNDKVVISITGISRIDAVDYPTSGLVSYDVSTRQMMRLGRKAQGLEGDDVIYVDPAGEYLLLAVATSVYDWPGVYRVNIADNSFTQIVKPQDNIWRWLADNKGIVRMGLAFAPSATRIYYRRTNDEKFALIGKIREKDDDESKKESLIDITRIVAGRDDGYILSNKETGRFALYKFNYLTREIGEKILDHKENDITDFDLSEDGTTLESAHLTDERDRIVWFNPLYSKYQALLDKALPGQEAWIQSKSRDGSRMTVYSTSPTDPGSYYLFEPAAKRLNRFAGVNDKIDPALMAVTKYVRYTARDGLSIPAYLTLPPGRAPKSLPFIIMPHGGPYGVRDTLDFNAEVQFLANRGYAVLQPNFRGSETYGEDFYKKGEGQIGRAMQDDLDDGMDWLVDQGIADPARACIVGSSYGGYAAMWGVIRNPERYRCAASFAGVTDFKTQLRYTKRKMRSRYAREWQNTVLGEADFDLDRVSPAAHAAKLSRPILLTHGDEDTRVPFSQYEKMIAALKKAGKTVEAHVYKGEGHGFKDVANAKDWLDRLEAFLAKNNPADPGSS